MQTIELKSQDLLIIDPCYIKHVEDERYDALKLVKVLHEGDDGEYEISTPDKKALLGVDSGRIWVLQAEFGFSVDIDAGLSGFIHISRKDIEDLDSYLSQTTKVSTCYEEDF